MQGMICQLPAHPLTQLLYFRGLDPTDTILQMWNRIMHIFHCYFVIPKGWKQPKHSFTRRLLEYMMEPQNGTPGCWKTAGGPLWHQHGTFFKLY